MRQPQRLPEIGWPDLIATLVFQESTLLIGEVSYA